MRDANVTMGFMNCRVRLNVKKTVSRGEEICMVVEDK